MSISFKKSLNNIYLCVKLIIQFSNLYAYAAAITEFNMLWMKSLMRMHILKYTQRL
jgi:hypothetical protein